MNTTDTAGWVELPAGTTWEDFAKAGLSRPGVLAEVLCPLGAGPERVLIGDVNEAGACDGGQPSLSHVLRYKVLVKKDW